MHFIDLLLIQMECFGEALFTVLKAEVFRLFLISSGR